MSTFNTQLIRKSILPLLLILVSILTIFYTLTSLKEQKNQAIQDFPSSQAMPRLLPMNNSNNEVFRSYEFRSTRLLTRISIGPSSRVFPIEVKFSCSQFSCVEFLRDNLYVLSEILTHQGFLNIEEIGNSNLPELTESQRLQLESYIKEQANFILEENRSIARVLNVQVIKTLEAID